jgi:hypothetical protein
MAEERRVKFAFLKILVAIYQVSSTEGESHAPYRSQKSQDTGNNLRGRISLND